MEYFEKIQWYHVVILVLILIILFLIFTRSFRSEGFNQNQTEKKQESQPEMILFYADWCGHSRNFLPEWIKFEEYAKQNLPNVKVSKIKCEDGNEAICNQKGIRGYPTVMCYFRDGREIMYDKQRTKDDLVKFVRENFN